MTAVEGATAENCPGWGQDARADVLAAQASSHSSAASERLPTFAQCLDRIFGELDIVSQPEWFDPETGRTTFTYIPFTTATTSSADSRTHTVEDGDGSMLVASASDALHHGSAHHDARDPPPVSTTETETNLPNMEVAPAPVAHNAAPDVAMANAPAHPADSGSNDTTTTTTNNNDNNNGDAALPSDTMPVLGDPISLPQPDFPSGDLNYNMNGMDMGPVPLPMDPPQPVPSAESLSAFARLRFDDGSYYMHTYQIVLGRNLQLAHEDMRRLMKVDQLNAQGREQAAANLLRRGRKRRGARSVISERGGIVSAPLESMPFEYQQRRQSNASHSQSSASHPNQDSTEEKPAERAPQDILMQALPPMPAQVDYQVSENPYDCPLVPIHPQHVTDRNGEFGPKGISREHAKIFYDYEAGHFAVEVLGTNGLRHEGNFLSKGEIAPLDHGDRLEIGAVNIQFYLPDIALSEYQRQRQESGSRPMSFSFENGHGELATDEELSSESEGQQSINPRHVFHFPLDSDVDDDEDAVEDEDMDNYEEPVPRPRQKAGQKAGVKLKINPPAPPAKESKKSQKRKQKEASPEEVLPKKQKVKHKDHSRETAKEPKSVKEPKEPKEPKEVKEAKEPKEPEEPKDKGKTPAKAPAKTPAKSTVKEESVEATPQEPPTDKNDPAKAIPTDSPPLLRKPTEGELESGDVEGLITEEMAREHNLPASLIGQIIEKRKGPGRPPKDGLMSKRIRSQLVKQAKEIDRAKAAGINPETIPMLTMKPKAAKRKDSNTLDGEEGDIRDSTEGGDGFGQKLSKPIKPPRTPSPELRESDYTAEQLKRPNINYVVMIHEAISSSSSGQMNLQQIYNYIEKQWPYYKFKVTTSGWQSSVRHNLGQHDAFVKGDKEGKGFNWKINPEVSIEKERRKRQVSPPVNHAQQQPYYPPPQNGYPSYPQPGYPYHPGMPPHGMPPSAPRLPPSLANAQPRLPPSMARDANAAGPATPQNTTHASPYASPWAAGNNAGSPPAPNPSPYAQPNTQPPPASSAAGSSGQYGVLYPTSAAQSGSGQAATASPYAGPYGSSGPSPYGPGPSRPYAPYPPPGQQPTGTSDQPQPSPQPRPPTQYRPAKDALDNVPPGRYLPTTHPDLIRQLEAFRNVYLAARKEPGEDQKCDNAIRAYIDPSFAVDTLNSGERSLYKAISGIENLHQYLPPEILQRVLKEQQQEREQQQQVQQQPQQPAPPAPVTAAPTLNTTTAGTAAAIAADQAASTAQAQPAAVPVSQASQSSTEEQKVKSHASISTNAAPAASATQSLPTASDPAPAIRPFAPSHRPSVEPLTPVPGSPAAPNGTPGRRPIDVTAGVAQGTPETKTAEENPAPTVPEPKKVEEETAAPKAE